MKSLKRFFTRLANLAPRRRDDSRLNEEIAEHIALQTAENLRAGLPPAEARRQALLKFGAVASVSEDYRAERRFLFFDTLFQDIRYALRMLRKSPGFTAVAVLTLALGIGANTAIFSIVDAVLLRPLPYRDPGRLVYISEFWPREAPIQTVPSPDFANWTEHNQLLGGLAAYGGAANVNMASNAGPERVQAVPITANFFSLLGVKPLHGRAFLPGEDRPNGPSVVILSQELWRDRFGSDPGIIGRSIKLDGAPYAVVGIAPARFRFPDDQIEAQLFLPIRVALAASWSAPQYFRLVRTLARLKPGITPAQAQSELSSLVTSTAALEPTRFKRMRAGMEVRITPLHQRLAAPARSILLLLFACVGFLLILCCVNIAGLKLARGASREQEFAVRAALGASKSRLVRQLLEESLLLAIVAIPAALLVGVGTLSWLRALAPSQIPHLESVRLDPFVLLLTAVFAILAALIAGVSPAVFASRIAPNEVLNHSGQSSASRGYRARGFLATMQIALAAVLLVGSGLQCRSLINLILVDTGFDPHHVLTAHISLDSNEYSAPWQQSAFFWQLIEHLDALPGTQFVGVTSGLPSVGWGSLRGTNVEGKPQLPIGLRPEVPTDVVSTQYFQAMRIPLVAGREFNNQDHSGSSEVAIVNRAFVRRFFPDKNPIDKRIQAGPEADPWRVIVGVVGDVRQLGPDQSALPEIYIPYLQEPTPDMFVVLRTMGDPQASLEQVNSAVRALDSSQPLYDAATMDARSRASIAPQRFNALLVGVFAGLALCLGAIGIYGVLAYFTRQRTHEIGIRMALGAQPGHVVRLIVAHGLKLALAGVAVGIAGSLALSKLLTSFLFGVSDKDPLTFAAVAIVLTLVALVACYIPARRAMCVDPMVALRYE
jgi:predicted permease